MRIYIRSNLLAAIVDCIYLTDTTVKLAFQLAFILQELTYLFTLWTVLFLLYLFINHFQERSTGRVSDMLILVHGTIFGLLCVVCVVELTLYICYTVNRYDRNQRWTQLWHWFQSGRKIAFSVVSFEIAIWALVVAVRASKLDRLARVCRYRATILR